MKWITNSVFIDVDTGEVLNITNERQLKYRNYRLIRKTKRIKGDEKRKIIEYTNECKFTGQREIGFEW